MARIAALQKDNTNQQWFCQTSKMSIDNVGLGKFENRITRNKVTNGFSSASLNGMAVSKNRDSGDDDVVNILSLSSDFFVAAEGSVAAFRGDPIYPSICIRQK